MSRDNYDSGHPNSGHGHVYQRPDGARMRCGGPGICSYCGADQARKLRESLVPTDTALLTSMREYVASVIDPSKVDPSRHLPPTENHRERVVAALSRLLATLKETP